jgi:hypothetical protein
LLVALMLDLGCCLLGRENTHAFDCGWEPAPALAPVAIDFPTQIQPVLVARCMPCHFPGGVMYDRLPFDQPKTIHTLGEKLFTRIKDENEQRLIREFLAQPF